MEHISPIIIALLAFVGGGGLLAIVQWFNVSYRKARRAEWKKEASESDLSSTKMEIEKIKTSSDQMDFMLRSLNELKISSSEKEAEHKIFEKMTSLAAARNHIFSTKVLEILEIVVDNCDCDENTQREIDDLKRYAKIRTDAQQ